ICHGRHGLVDGFEGTAQVDQKLALGLCRGGTAFVAGFRRLEAIHFGGETEIGASDVLYLFGECTELSRAVSGSFVLEVRIGGTKAVFVFGHSFGGGADLVFLVLKTAGKGGRHGFLLSDVGSRGILRFGEAGNQEDESNKNQNDDSDGREFTLVMIHGWELPQQSLPLH